MKLKKYITAAVIVLAVAVIVGLNTVTRENMASSPVLITQAGEGGYIDFKVPEGGKIKEILFSSYGNPYMGSDGKPKRGTCHADTWIKRECEGKSPPTCTGIRAHNHFWGDPCHGTSKRLLVAYTVTDPIGEAQAAAIQRAEQERAAQAAIAASNAAAAQAAADAAAQRAEQERVAQAALATSNAAAAQAAATVAAQRDAINADAASKIAAANRTTGTAATTTPASTPVVTTTTRISEDKTTSTPPSAAASTPAPAAASTASTPAPAAASTAAPAASTPAAAAVSTGKTSKEETDNTMMYVALGMGAVVLLLGVFMMSSRRQPAPVMAGRRR